MITKIVELTSNWFKGLDGVARGVLFGGYIATGLLVLAYDKFTHIAGGIVAATILYVLIVVFVHAFAKNLR